MSQVLTLLPKKNSLSKYSDAESKLGNRTLWDNDDKIARNLKEAISLVPELKGQLVDLDSSYQVVVYRSGHNETQFFQFICDGIYAMELREKKDKQHGKISITLSSPSRASTPAQGEHRQSELVDVITTPTNAEEQFAIIDDDVAASYPNQQQ